MLRLVQQRAYFCSCMWWGRVLCRTCTCTWWVWEYRTSPWEWCQCSSCQSTLSGAGRVVTPQTSWLLPEGRWSQHCWVPTSWGCTHIWYLCYGTRTKYYMWPMRWHRGVCRTPPMYPTPFSWCRSGTGGNDICPILCCAGSDRAISVGMGQALMLVWFGGYFIISAWSLSIFSWVYYPSIYYII